MSRIVLTDVEVELDGVDLSSHIGSVEISQTFDDIETTAFGVGGRTRVAGLEDSELSLTFHQDFGTVEDALGDKVGQVIPFTIKPTDEAVGAENPSYSGEVLVTEWTALSGDVGDLSTIDVTWPVSGKITKAID